MNKETINQEKVNKVSKNKRASNDRFDAKTYTRRTIKFRNEEHEALVEYCKEHNLTINGFVREALMKAISKDSDSK